MSGAPGASWPRSVAVALAFALALWAKLTTPIMVAFLLLGWIALSGRWVAARRLAGAGVAGTLLFGVTWWAFATAWGLPALRPFTDLAYEVLDSVGLTPQALTPLAVTAVAAGAPEGLGGVGGAGYVALRALVALLRSAQWLHPLFIGVLVAAPLALRRREPAAALLLVAALAMTLYLIKLAAGFPKYHAGVLPLAVVAAGVAAARWLGAAQVNNRGSSQESSRRSSQECGSSARSGAGNASRRVPGGVPLRLIIAGGVVGIAASVIQGSDALIRQAEPRLLAAWLGAAAACMALGAFTGARPAAGLAFGLLLGTNLAVSISQARAGWSTAYFYGASGQVAAGAWITQQAAPGERIVADRDAAYYAAGVHFMDSERFADLVRRGAGCAPAALTRLVVTRHATVAALLPPQAAPAAVFGDFRAWVLAQPSAADEVRRDGDCHASAPAP